MSETLDRALLGAVLANDLPGATDCIVRGANVNRRGPLAYTPLMLAAGRGAVQMTERLLVAGADVHVIDSVMGASALHYAAQSGTIDVARLLLDHGAFINLQTPTTGLTPLITAVWAKQVSMVRYLLERGATLDVRTNLGGATVWDFIGSGIRWTAGFTEPEAERWGREIRALLEARQQQDAAVQAGQPLMQAVLQGDLAEVTRLIAANADVNAKTPVLANGNDGQTPLLVACFLGHGEIAAELLAAGADPHIVDFLLGATPAHKAAYAGRPEALRALRDQGAVEINAQGPFNGYTALHDAVWHGHREAMEVILDWPGVRLDLRGLDGRTADELAADLGYHDLADQIRARLAPAVQARSAA